jgi:alanine dehydrogenase
VAELTALGHEVWVETHAGAAIGFADEDYLEAGAQIAKSSSEVFQQGQLIAKVKEPLAVERARLRAHHTLFTYLHLAPDRAQTEELMASGATCIAYETVTDA